MYLALFHGEAIVFGILLAGVLFWLSALALFVWKWRYVTEHKLQVIGLYLLLVAVLCSPLLSLDSDFLGFILGTALTLPWSLFMPALLGVVENPALAASLFFCGVINAVLFFLGGLLLQRQIQSAAG